MRERKKKKSKTVTRNKRDEKGEGERMKKGGAMPREEVCKKRSRWYHDNSGARLETTGKKKKTSGSKFLKEKKKGDNHAFGQTASNNNGRDRSTTMRKMQTRR